jgi:hypothetical protein
VNERRGTALGIVLLAIGSWFLLRQYVDLSGPGPVLVLIGAILFAVSAANRFSGPIVAACVLLGLGAACLLRRALSPWLSHGSLILLGLGAGFLAVTAIDAATKRRRGTGPLVAGLVLTGLGLLPFASRWIDLTAFRDALDRYWPWLLIVAGIALIASALRKKDGPAR